MHLRLYLAILVNKLIEEGNYRSSFRQINMEAAGLCILRSFDNKSIPDILVASYSFDCQTSDETKELVIMIKYECIGL